MPDPVTPPATEPVKPSKTARVKSALITGGAVVLPAVVTVGSAVVGLKMSLNQLEAAKLTAQAVKQLTANQ